MNQNDLQSIKNDLSIYILRYPKLNNTKLAELFITETKPGLSLRSIRRYVSLVKEADNGLNEELDENDYDTKDSDDFVSTEHTEKDWYPTQEEQIFEQNLDEHIEEELNEESTSYQFKFKYNGKDYVLNRQFVDKVICAYSRQGLNLTAGAIQNILDIDADTLKAIIYRLNITKESKPYSEYSENNYEETVVYEELESNISYILDKMYENDGTTINKLNKIYKRNILLEQHKDLKFKTLLSEIKQLLPEVKISKYSPDKDELESGNVHLIIPDMHIGLNQQNYNVDIIRDKLNEVVNNINNVSKDNIKVHVHFMGDIIHSVSGLNHKDSWKDMKQGTSGAEAIIQPYKLLLEFLSNINSLYKVNFVGGELVASK